MTVFVETPVHSLNAKKHEDTESHHAISQPRLLLKVLNHEFLVGVGALASPRVLPSQRTSLLLW